MPSNADVCTEFDLRQSNFPWLLHNNWAGISKSILLFDNFTECWWESGGETVFVWIWYYCWVWGGGGVVYEGCCCNYLVSTNYWSICHNMSLILGLSIISHCCVTTLTSQEDDKVADQWYLTDAWQPLQATTVFLLPYLLCRHLHTNIIQFYAISTYRESCARAL